MSTIRSLSVQQIEAAESIINAFNNPSDARWCILIAQMQSGKTETYLLASCEAIRQKIVKNVVIFSGNAEIDLKKQLKNEIEDRGSAFYNKYRRYLMSKNIDFDEIDDIFGQLKNVIQVVWGTELTKFDDETNNTLFVWEESHHAQNITQCPDKFLKKIGISADGDNYILSRNDNYLISISATPFSEISDVHHHSQEKKCVYLHPGDSYNSVQKMLESNRIKQYSVIREGLKAALSTPHTGFKYGIVRITVKNEELIKSIIVEFGWNYVVFDSLSTGEEKKIGQDTWDNMKKTPNFDTVILLRGKCRMGKNLEKKNVLFVMETAKNSKTDTVLQGLLGRVCGYSEGSTTIDVYLHQKIMSSGELNRYIEMIDNIVRYGSATIIPNKANNISKTRLSNLEPIVPIKIIRNRNISVTNDREKLLQDVVNAFETGRVQNKNSSEVFNKIQEKVLRAYRENKTNLRTRGLDDTKKTRNIEKARQITDAFEMGIPRGFGSGCGASDGSTDDQINIWFPKHIEGFDMNTIYITANILKAEQVDLIPQTTKREVFAHKLEDDTEVVGNGGFVILLSPETAINVTAMYNELQYMIELSKTSFSSKRVSSCFDVQDKEFKGILVNSEVLNALEKGGRILKDVKDRHGVTLTIKKSRGPIKKEIKDRGLIRLESISW
jgi:hypothetical protein